MNIRCISLGENGFTANDWDMFVRQSNNGTLFHSQSFLEYHPSDRFSNHSLIFYKGDNVISLLPATIIGKEEERTISSHCGASWGGWVYKEPLRYSECVSIVSSLLKQAANLHCSKIEITLPPAIYHKRPNDYFPFLLLQQGFVYSRRELTSVVKLASPVLPATFDRSVRKGMNKAVSLGIEIRENVDDWSEFYTILIDCLNEKGKNPTHSLSELQGLTKRFPGRIVLWGAYLKGEMIGGMCNWLINDETWLVFYSAYKKELNDARILDYLFASSLENYANRGFKYLDFGTSSLNMKVNAGLIRFKENFAAFGVFRDTLTYSLN